MSKAIEKKKSSSVVASAAPHETHAESASHAAPAPVKAPRQKESAGQRIRIRIKAYDSKIIDGAVRQIIENVEKFGVEIVGPVPLPTEIKKYTVNRSTFVHKNAREQFEMRVHKRLLDILDPNQKVIESLTNLNLPAGVDIEIKL